MHHHRPKLGITAVGAILVRLPFQPLMQLHGGLEQQEYPAEQQDKIAAREAEIADAEQRCGQGYHPGDHRQQAQTHQQRQRQADNARLIALLRRQFVGQNGDEHQVVDAQHDFQHHQRKQPRPNRGVH